MLALTLAAALLMTSPQATASQSQSQTSAQDPANMAPVDLEDVVVEGRRLEDTTEQFVREVGAPSRGRGLARWRGGVCAGVANLGNEAAQFLVDRVSDRARGVGLRAGAPGCTPNILIVATTDAKAFTPQFVAMRPRLFRVGGSGMDRGGSALASFERSDSPVRWWHVSAPVDDTGQIAVRIPGYCENACTDPSDYAPKVSVTGSHLMNRTEDDIKRVFIIVDVDKIAGASLDQLGDYVSMVALAQIDPEADTRGYSTILNLFDDPQNTQTMTQWDHAYLNGLYQAVRTRANTGAARMEVVSSIVRARRDLDKDEVPESMP